MRTPMTQAAADLVGLMMARGVGHTHAMQLGIDNYRADMIVVGMNDADTKRLVNDRKFLRDKHKTFEATLHNLDQFKGLHCAVAIDHAALTKLLTCLIRQIDDKDEAINKLEHKLQLVKLAVA